jgi:glutamate-5-semialdehyde dehydrogenase
MEDQVRAQARAVKDASMVLSTSTTAVRNAVLRGVAARLKRELPAILAANRRDLAAASRTGLSNVLIDRLTLNPDRVRQLWTGVLDVQRLPDPLNRVLRKERRPNGLLVEQNTVPLGAVGIIYEARPNVTIDAAVLCLKSGNAVLLRGGSEAIHSNRMLTTILKKAVRDEGLPESCVEMIRTTDRKAVVAMLKQDRTLDVIIPRGSQRFVSYIREHSRVPVIVHGEGNCHVFVDRSADLAMAEEIVFNAKVQRPSVCNAAEKLLVHKSIARTFLPSMARRLSNAGVELRGDAPVRALLPNARAATEEDWYREYLDLILAIKLVDGLDDAIAHINRYGSHHSDAIVTGIPSHGERFLRHVDSAAVYVNASTRFTDGFELGLGAEIGISTQKLHARGPMGLEELTSSKFIVHGKGHVRR